MLLVGGQGAAWSCELSVRVTESPPRFQLVEGEWQGIQVELTNALMEEAGCKARYVQMSWSRALKELENGNLDVMGEMSVTPEREQFLRFLGPHSDETMIMVVRADSDYRIQSLDDLKAIPGKFGLAHDSWYGEAVSRKLEEDADFRAKVEFVRSDYIQLERVKLGRIFGYVVMHYPAVYRIRTDPELKDDLKIHEYVFNEDWVYWGLSKASVDETMYERLRAAYIRLKQAGTLERITERYTQW